jgi:perosamine synthetase
MLADYVGTKRAVVTVNGTSALHIALLIAQVEPDDEVLVSTLSFVAPANAIRYVGAWPVFMDSEPDYWQMDPGKLEEFLSQECRWQKGSLVNKTSGRRVKAILPVHILGHPCDMDPITELAKNYGLAVVEDATESLSAGYKGRMVGQLGDVACFSFNGNKLITTGGGGMIVTDNHEWADRARYLTTQAKDDPVEYIHNEIGYNYRLSNIQSAMGVAQLELLEDFVEAKRAIADRYRNAFQALQGITPMPAQPATTPAYWLYTILLSPGTALEERQGIIRALNNQGIGSRPLWRPIHGLPPYSSCQSYHVETSMDLYHRAVSLPSSAGLTEPDQQRSIDSLKSVLGYSGSDCASG